MVLSDTSEVLSYVPLSSFLNFRGIIIWAGILSFKLPWYYWKLPRYYHMCRYLLSYASTVFSHVPVSSLLGFRSNSIFSSGWSQFSLFWSLGFLDSPAVTVCLWTLEHGAEGRSNSPLSHNNWPLGWNLSSFFLWVPVWLLLGDFCCWTIW